MEGGEWRGRKIMKKKNHDLQTGVLELFILLTEI